MALIPIIEELHFGCKIFEKSNVTWTEILFDAGQNQNRFLTKFLLINVIVHAGK